jgi:hypothetical protein
VRRRVRDLLTRTIDDMTDAELMQRAADQYWYTELCLERLHRLPSEVDRIITCREYTHLQAFALVKRAIADMTRIWREER